MNLISLLFILTAAPFTYAQEGQWIVRHNEWTIDDEVNYSQFVQAIGRTPCKSVSECIKSEANPYRDTDPEDAKFYSDCADFPYFLRAYFAWKNDLPFGYIAQVRSFDADQLKKAPLNIDPLAEPPKPIDNRYTSIGNYPVARQPLVPTAQKELNFFAANARLQNIISSAMYRFAPDQNLKVQSDFYSPEIKPGSIRPGTVIYDPNGHVAVVYDVLPDGRILHFDAHPDNSVTHGIYSSKFSRSKPGQGAGFKNFRPLQLVNAQPDPYQPDQLIGGQLVYAKNPEIRDYSITQYYGAQPNMADWKQGTFQKDGKNLTFQEYVRRSLATEKINPVTEFLGGLQELCGALAERSQSVEAATKKEIQLKPHPATLPQNLFGAEGDWENYATPGRDTRLRTTFLELKKNAEERYTQWQANDFSDMKYNGQDLKKDLLRAFHKVNLECTVSYTNSTGRKVQLGFELAIKRLFQLSFDPYICPERRWGATHPDELKTCTDDAEKQRWDRAAQSVRNFLQRDWSASGPITVEDLESAKYGSGTAPTIDLRGFLEALPNK